MMEILFQDDVLRHIDSFTIETFPHTVLLKGSVGSGKHLVGSYIANKFNAELVDITENLDFDTITEISLSPIIRFYLINADSISVKEQNVILKLLEEPGSFAYILMLTSTGNLLETIISRCYEIKLSNYSKDNLSTFLHGNEDSTILDIAETPGQIKELIDNDFKSMVEFSDKIFFHIKTANLSNCLTIPNKIKFSDSDSGEFPVDIFVKVLSKVSIKYGFKVYNLTRSLYNDLYIPKVNKKLLFENYLINLKYL